MPVCNVHDTWRQSAIYMIPAILLRFAFRAIFYMSACAKEPLFSFYTCPLSHVYHCSVQITWICRFLPFHDLSLVECVLKSPWGWFCPSLLTCCFPQWCFVNKIYFRNYKILGLFLFFTNVSFSLMFNPSAFMFVCFLISDGWLLFYLVWQVFFFNHQAHTIYIFYFLGFLKANITLAGVNHISFHISFSIIWISVFFWVFPPKHFHRGSFLWQTFWGLKSPRIYFIILSYMNNYLGKKV